MPDRAGRLGRVARSTPLRWIAAAAVVAAVVVTWSLTRHGAPSYRTASAAAASVSQTVSAVGTLEPLSQDDLAFATAGTVATVDATVGQQVTAGQQVATLATAPLQQAVDDAQASLASAQARLASDEAAQAGTSSTAASTASDTAPPATAAATLTAFTPGGGSGGSTPGGSSGGTTTVATAQAALVAAQHRLDLAEATESTDLEAATSTCGNALAPGSSTPASACTAALATVTADQRAVSTALAAVYKAESALAAALSAAQHTAPTTTTTTPPSSPSPGPAPSNRQSPSTSSGNGGTPASTVTPQQVAVDQASVDQAQAQLASAQTDLADATLVSPIAGTVASVDLVQGQAVKAGSTSSTIVVIGPGSYEATVDIPVTSIAGVATGQHAVVTPDATDRAVSGTVTSISALPVSSSGSTDYPVSVALSSAGLPLGSGGSAQVTIVIRTASAAVTVPTSAIHTFGSRHLVDRLVNGKAVATVVGVGVVGPTRTQITSGLSDGSEVVLADMGAPLPASNTSSPGLARAIAGGGRFRPRGG